MHDFAVPDMLHARVIRPAAVGAKLVSVDEVLDQGYPRRESRAGEGSARRRRRRRMERGARLPRAACAMERGDRPAGAEPTSSQRCAPSPALSTRRWSTREAPAAQRPDGAKALTATYYWPMQSHASIGPSCAVADVRADAATVWTASQGTHGNQTTFARFLGLPQGKGAADLSRGLRLLRHERPRGRRGRRRDPVARQSDARCACNGRARTSSAGIRKARRS